MRYRTVELFYEQALDDTGTKPIDLKTTDPITAIRLEFKGVNGTDPNLYNWMNDVISKIEIVDGSDQILSINMKHGQALQFVNTGKTPYMRMEERPSGGVAEQCLIRFGRFMNDPLYYLDLTKFTNPQLKITTAGLTPNASGSGGFLAGSYKVTINLHVIEEGAQPSAGFMMYKEFFSFTAATSGDEHIALPQDYPYVGLLMRAFYIENDIHETINRLKISCDTGKFIPIDKKVHDIYRMNEEDYGPLELRMQLHRANGETVYHPLQMEPVAILMADQSTCVLKAMYQWSGYFELEVVDVSGNAITASRWIRAIIQGGSLHSTIYLPFGILTEPNTYFDPKIWADIELILTQGCPAGELGAVSLVMQQLRSY